MANQAQKAKIHIAKKELKLTDIAYEGMLAKYGVSTSRDLSYSEAEELLLDMQAQGWEPKRKMNKGTTRHGWGRHKYEYLRPRPANMADPKQLRKIEAMWRDIARNKSDESLEQFVERQTRPINQPGSGVKKLVWLTKEHARAILTALKEMK
ncbi:regulatory protein GemA [Gracilimonas tropica]|uniref:regulatory protein GemA n=1 Tax=Gracilimonas tropica TaxID=454600 RepID=UPI0003810A38|nr:regulatory protein GemA [Gracilimonas tropica]